MKEINRYRLALIQYYLSYIFPKSWFKTQHGLCWHFIHPLPFPETLKQFEPDYFCAYWFKRGQLKPRIKILKEAIQLLKQK